MKVITKDFQRLKGENEFEFPVGITIIQGRSGSGKSSLFYAVEDCLSNPSGVADVINWDAKSAEVSIENENEKITWIKTPTSCEYVDKDGKPYVKASKIDSRNLGNLGFYFDKKDNIVNIHGEWSLLFPFGASDTEMFKLFEDIFNISSSFQVIDVIKKDEQEYKSKISDLNKQSDAIKQQNNQINSILGRVDSNVDAYLQDIQEKKQFLDNIVGDYNLLTTNYTYSKIIIPDEFILDKVNISEIISDYNTYKNNLSIINIEIPEEQSFEIKENVYMDDYTEYQTLLNDILVYNESLKQLETEEKSLKEKLKEIKVCPTCGHSLEYANV